MKALKILAVLVVFATLTACGSNTAQTEPTAETCETKAIAYANDLEDFEADQERREVQWNQDFDEEYYSCLGLDTSQR